MKTWTSENERSGQVLLEFALSSGLLLLTLVGSGWVLRAQWQRTRCAVLTFERTHAAAHERIPAWTGSIRFRLDSSDDEMRGEGQCDSIQEKVRIPRLR